MNDDNELPLVHYGENESKNIGNVNFSRFTVLPQLYSTGADNDFMSKLAPAANNVSGRPHTIGWTTWLPDYAGEMNSSLTKKLLPEMAHTLMITSGRLPYWEYLEDLLMFGSSGNNLSYYIPGTTENATHDNGFLDNTRTYVWYPSSSDFKNGLSVPNGYSESSGIVGNRGAEYYTNRYARGELSEENLDKQLDLVRLNLLDNRNTSTYYSGWNNANQDSWAGTLKWLGITGKNLKSGLSPIIKPFGAMLLNGFKAYSETGSGFQGVLSGLNPVKTYSTLKEQMTDVDKEDLAGAIPNMVDMAFKFSPTNIATKAVSEVTSTGNGTATNPNYTEEPGVLVKNTAGTIKRPVAASDNTTVKSTTPKTYTEKKNKGQRKTKLSSEELTSFLTI